MKTKDELPACPVATAVALVGGKWKLLILRNLRSRPMKDLNWSYYFFVEAEGNINTQSGQNMLSELSAVCAKLKLVGTYSEVKA